MCIRDSCMTISQMPVVIANVAGASLAKDHGSTVEMPKPEPAVNRMMDTAMAPSAPPMIAPQSFALPVGPAMTTSSSIATMPARAMMFASHDLAYDENVCRKERKRGLIVPSGHFTQGGNDGWYSNVADGRSLDRHRSAVSDLLLCAARARSRAALRSSWPGSCPAMEFARLSVGESYA